MVPVDRDDWRARLVTARVLLKHTRSANSNTQSERSDRSVRKVDERGRRLTANHVQVQNGLH